MVINLRNYVLAVFQVMLHTMRCAHGSIAKILMEWDPGPICIIVTSCDLGECTLDKILLIPVKANSSILPLRATQAMWLRRYTHR